MQSFIPCELISSLKLLWLMNVIGYCDYCQINTGMLLIICSYFIRLCYYLCYINELVGFARWNTLTITCEIHGDRTYQNIHPASRLQLQAAHILDQHENHIYRRPAFTVHCHHLHLSATDLHHMQVRHPLNLHIRQLVNIHTGFVMWYCDVVKMTYSMLARWCSG